MPTSPADTAIGNLFGEPELPADFRYMPEVLSPAEEKGLVQRLEKLPLKPFEFRGYLGNRRIYSFGHRYIFAGHNRVAEHRVNAFSGIGSAGYKEFPLASWIDSEIPPLL